ILKKMNVIVNSKKKLKEFGALIEAELLPPLPVPPLPPLPLPLLLLPEITFMTPHSPLRQYNEKTDEGEESDIMERYVSIRSYEIDEIK
ncbi:3034_t:CDS:2, partial [Dentiscutata erythropus]